MILSTLLALALADVLTAGKPAPALSPEKFLLGSEVKQFEKNKVYVVEFWATWCPPCRASVPHLTQLQKENPDITVIGVAGFERGKDAEANEKLVRDFITSKGSEMAYTIAFDSDGSMSRDWMTAAKQRGIPCAFVVDGTGKVSYIGSPDENLNKAVAAAKGKSGAGKKGEKSKKTDSTEKGEKTKGGTGSSSQSGSSSSSGATGGASSGSSSSSSKTSTSGSGAPR